MVSIALLTRRVSIPAALTLLQEGLLGVPYHDFHGNLPIDVGLTLPNLKLIAVTENNFSGIFPTSITNASGLEEGT